MVTNSLSEVASSPYSAVTRAPSNDGGVGKDDFLKLLTTQLAKQDPLNPTDSTAFLSQLAQFSGLEQMTNIREGIDLLAITQTAGTSAQMVSFIGKEVEFEADNIILSEDGEPPEMYYSINEDAVETTVVVKNELGDVVRTYELGAENSGNHTLTFDGRDEQGNVLPPGSYDFTVAARDADDEEVDTSTRSNGIVDAIIFKEGYPQLMLKDGRTVMLAQVMSVLQGESPVSTATTPTASEINLELMEQSKTNTSLLDVEHNEEMPF
jgi:flagellar basal-body rod modification protein FlgD